MSAVTGEATPNAAAEKRRTLYRALAVVPSELPESAAYILHASGARYSASQFPAEAFESSETLAAAATRAVLQNIDGAIRDNDRFIQDVSADDLAAARAAVPRFVEAAVHAVFPVPPPKPSFEGVISYPLQRYYRRAYFDAWQYAPVAKNNSYSPGFYPGDGRRPYGTLVLGPSGSGKSAFLEHELLTNLKTAAKGAPVAVVVANLGSVLKKLIGWYLRGTAKERVKEGGDCLAARVRDIVLEILAEHALTRRTYVAVCLDEIGVLPGVLSEKATWDAVAEHVRAIGETAPYKDLIAGVHVAAAGTAAECGVKEPLPSNLPEITKLRLAQWTPDTVLRTIGRTPDGEGAALTAIVKVLCGEPHGIVSAMSNARMAMLTLRTMSGKQQLPLAWDGSEVNVTYVRKQRSSLLPTVVKGYCDENSLSRILQEVRNLPANDPQRGTVCGVGLGALWVCMRQRARPTPADPIPSTPRFQASVGRRSASERSDGVDDDDDDDDETARALERVCARTAEHFGLIVSNADKHAAPGELAYEIHAGTVLVALHLLGLDVTETPATWKDLEELVVLDESVSAAAKFLLSIANYDDVSHNALPTALQRAHLPWTTGPLQPPLVWNNRTQPVSVGAATCVTLPLNLPCNVVAHDPFGDVLGHRRTTTLVAAAADVPEEMAKAGLLQYTEAAEAAPPTAASRAKVKSPKKTLAQSRSAREAAATPPTAARADDDTSESQAATTLANASTMAQLQQGVLDALTRQWARYEAFREKPSQRTAASFAPGKSRLGDSQLYPLILLLRTEALQPAPFPLYVDNVAYSPPPPEGLPDGVTVGRAAAMETTRGARQPRESPAPSRTGLHAGRARARVPPQVHSDWCEFRMVVTDRDQAGLGGDVTDTLAVFERGSVQQGWALAHPIAGAGSTHALGTALLPRLRVDMPLTLLAVTVADVGDAGGRSEDVWLPEQSSPRQPPPAGEM